MLMSAFFTHNNAENMKKILILVASISLSACMFSAGEHKEIAAIKIPLSDTDNILRLSQVADSLSYIKLESDTNCMIGRIDKIIPAGENIIVVDKEVGRSVFIFNRSGKFQSKISRHGRGPGEYIKIKDVVYNYEAHTIIIADDAKFLSYSMDGKFMTEVYSNNIVEKIEYVGNNTLALFSNYVRLPDLIDKSRYPNLLLFDIKKEAEAPFLYFDGEINTEAINDMVSNFSRYGTKNDISFMMPLNDTLYQISESDVVAQYVLDFGEGRRKEVARLIKESKRSSANAFDAAREFEESSFPILLNYIKSEELIFLFYKKGEMFYYGFYYPSKNVFLESAMKYVEGVSGSRIPMINDMDIPMLFMPMATDGSNFYFVMESVYLEYFKNSPSPQMQELIRTSTLNDNPIIIVAKMK